ncbi:unnamed protein product [Anisakis simplex]|uniref:Uncharacterized protein n=1 Tax=Anisakis simplex TaxID=6269 RepID=A0A3P6P2R1_ANISI|nr:unnamed protein product [Anisakis simplex]
MTRKVFRDYIYKALPFEPIRVPRMFAAELFAENQRKADCILNHEDDDVILCKVGEHVDVVEGPVISNTRQIGRFAVTGVDYVDAQYHFRGVSLPSPVKCSSYSWDLIVNAATVSSAPRLLQSGTQPSQNELQAS